MLSLQIFQLLLRVRPIVWLLIFFFIKNWFLSPKHQQILWLMWRHCLCTSELGVWQGRNIFCMLSDHSYGFYEIIGVRIETFLDFVQKTTNATGRTMIGHNLSPKNRTILFMIWLRCYPSYNLLSQLVGVSTLYYNNSWRNYYNN